MLIHTSETDIRFSEVDSMGIVWHGHFIKYFEDGREAFGKKYNLGYMDVYEEGFFMPIVDVQCSYKSPIRYRDVLVVETCFVETPAAKLIFEYRLYNKKSKICYATGRSEQVFLTKDRNLQLTVPEFFAEWKKKWLVANHA